MFHYTLTSIDGGRLRKCLNIAPGDTVRSNFRAAWTGKIVSLNPEGGLAVVLITHDRHGKPMRKQRVYRISVDWLTVIDKVLR